MNTHVILQTLSSWAKLSHFTYPLLLSLLSALIFWSAFSWLPFRKRYTKMRPIVELDMYRVYQHLFTLFDVIFSHSPHSPSFHQSDIRGARLTRQKIEIALQNKCLNNLCLYDPYTAPKMMVVGDKLQRAAAEIDGLANKILTFIAYTRDQEIILLEQIRKEVCSYDFDEKDIHRNPAVRIGATEYRPVNPSISYRTQNFVNLYAMFLELQGMVLIKNRYYLDRNLAITRVQYSYDTNDFKRCRHLAHKYSLAFPHDRNLIDGYHLLCQLRLKRVCKFRRELDAVLSRKPYSGSLVSMRWLFRQIETDPTANEMVRRYYSDDDIEQTHRTLIEEEVRQKQFYQQNEALLAYNAKRTGHAAK